MECKIKNRTKIVNDYVTGELGENERAEFELHYFGCDTCFQAVKLREKMIELIKDESDSLFVKYQKKKPAAARASFLERLQGVWPPLFNNRLIPVLASLILIFLLIGSYLTFQNIRNEDILSRIIYDEQLPFEFVPATVSFRSGLASSEDTLELDKFKNRFLEAMLEYKDRNYRRAIEMLEPLNGTANTILKNATEQKVLSLMRDYYFYFGVSHFALAQSKVRDLSEEIKRNHLAEAVKLLSVSEKIANTRQLDLPGRDTFFLSLAYGLIGRHSTAVTGLKNIQPASQYYKESLQLIHKWQD